MSYAKEIIQSGGIGIIPTDTLYGVVGSALSEKAVRRIYRLKGRNLKKPFIILIGDIGDLKKIGIRLTPNRKKILSQAWPGRVSVLLPTTEDFKYLHRGTKHLAVRLPQPVWLKNILKETGPLVAPSANPEGEPPAETIKAAQKYFEDNVDFYLDRGKRTGKPSTLVKIDKKVTILREGTDAKKVKKIIF